MRFNVTGKEILRNEEKKQGGDDFHEVRDNIYFVGLQ